VRQRGLWAFWARDEEHRIVCSGYVPPWAQDANDAEAAAAVAAIHVCLEQLSAAAGKILVVKTDSQTAVAWLTRGCRRPATDAMIKTALAKLEAAQMQFSIRWVKGHNGTGTTASYLNTRVDRITKTFERRSHADTEYQLWRVPIVTGDQPKPAPVTENKSIDGWNW